MVKVLCFDLDDTLIDDNYKFEQTFCECISFIIKALETKAPQIDEILQTARDFDNEYWRTWPAEKRYMPSRVATAWINTYRKIANEVEIPVRKHIERLLWSLVMTNYDPPYFVIPGVIETLTKLRQKGYQLHVVTIGHQNIQLRKLKVTHLIKFFEERHVVTSEKTLVLSELCKKHGCENVTMIGNSIRSDINPALEAAIKAIYIPRGNWHNFKAEPINNNFKTIKNIQELLSIL